MAGQQFNNWKVLKRDSENSRNWICLCTKCNKTIKSVNGTSLRSGKSKSCGCKPKNFINLTGQKFNHWTVIKQVESNNRGDSQWLCECDCENHTQKIVKGKNLRDNSSTSCGCAKRKTVINMGHNNAKNLIGQIFGYLEVLEKSSSTVHSQVQWKCKCLRCGNICEVTSSHLISGHTKSCGCLNSVGESIIKQILLANNISYETQKTFENLINPKTNIKLRYDFYLPVYNRLIEFDGEQHFKYRDNSRWNTKENFEKTQERDKIKNEYAKSHNIKLIRIPYWERDNITLEMLLGDQYLI